MSHSTKCHTKCNTEVWWILVYFNWSNLLSLIRQYGVTPGIKLWSCYRKMRVEEIKSEGTTMMFSFTFNVNNSIPYHNTGRYLFKLSYPTSKLWYGRSGRDYRTLILLEIVLVEGRKRHWPQPTPSAKSSEGVEEMMYIISQPFVKSAKMNKRKGSIQKSDFPIPWRGGKNTSQRIASSSKKRTEKAEK